MHHIWCKYVPTRGKNKYYFNSPPSFAVLFILRPVTFPSISLCAGKENKLGFLQHSGLHISYLCGKSLPFYQPWSQNTPPGTCYLTTHSMAFLTLYYIILISLNGANIYIYISRICPFLIPFRAFGL